MKMDRASIIVCVAILAVLTGLTIARNQAWRDHLTLYEDLSRKSPDKARVHLNLGLVYRDRGRLNDAIFEFELAEELARMRPGESSQNVGAVALSNLAALYLDFSGPDMLPAAALLLERAREEYPVSELVLANSIEVMLRSGEIERAGAFADAALRELPNSSLLRLQKAEVLSMWGRCEERDRLVQEAFERDRIRALNPPPMRPCPAFVEQIVQ